MAIVGVVATPDAPQNPADAYCQRDYNSDGLQQSVKIHIPWPFFLLWC